MGSIQDILGKRLPINDKFEGKKFKKNLSAAVIHSPTMGILKDNQDALNKVIGDSSNRTKLRRGLTKSEAKTMLQKIKKEGPISAGDERLIKKMLEGATREYRSKADTSKSTSSKTEKQNKKTARKAAIKNELRPGPARELPDFLKNRGSVSAKANPWAPDASSPAGSGGGIGAATVDSRGIGSGGGIGSGPVAPKGASSGMSRPPSLSR
jgi:hypothetical protein